MITAYVINIKKRNDRWKEICNHFQKKTKLLKLVRVDAHVGKPGGIYCALSHIKIVKMAKKQNLPYVMVLEDDTIIKISDFDTTMGRIMWWLENNINKWNIFNGNPNIRPKINKKIKCISPYPILFEYGYAQTANFVIYNRNCYDKIINFEKIYRKCIITKKFNYPKLAYDILINKFICIAPYPYLSSQKQDYSNIENKRVNYNNILQNSENLILNKIKNKYIGCKLMGGLGNQMFIIASVLSTCIDNGVIMRFNKKDLLVCKYRNNVYWDNYFKFINFKIPFSGYTKILNDKNKDENAYNFKKIEINSPRVSIDGYFQNINYFHKYKKYIANFFKLSNNDLNYIKQKYSYLFDNNIKKCAIHVRRGDYVKKKHYHHNVPITYYNKCIDIMNKYFDKDNCQFVVFSDDIKWCKNNFINNNIKFIKDEKDYIELEMMRYFDGYIIANSTFSWWGAYLSHNSNTKVLMPYKWVENGKYPNGLVVNGWTKISYV